MVRPGDVVPGSYIVALTAGGDVDRVAGRHGIPARALTARYTSALRGFAATLPPAAAARLANDPQVERVQPDRWMGLAATQSYAPWGLDRTDQRDLPLSGTYDYDTTGAGVKTYIIDTGVRASHRDFTGRVIKGFDAIDGGDGMSDCHGHGTHVAGTVAGDSYGIAKGVTVVPVRVMNCKGVGTTAEILAGIDWMVRQHVPGRPAVANMSIVTLLEEGRDRILDDAVRSAISRGITFALAAGNQNGDACKVSPANVEEALTVAASDEDDVRASFSNYGSCVDLFAPGKGILSAGRRNDTASATMSGTSMAAPHVAGAAARYLETMPDATPSEVAYAITTAATSPVIADAGAGSPTSLLYVDPLSDGAWVAQGPRPTSMAMTTSTGALTYGGSVTLYGTLSSGYFPVVSERVQVHQRILGSDTWVLLGSRLTDEHGRMSYKTEPSASADYRLRYRGGDSYEPSAAKAKVGVRTRVRATLSDDTVRRGDTAKLSGVVRPTHAGQYVALQARRDGTWSTVKSKALNARSRYAFTLPTGRKGTVAYRVVKPADIDHLTGTSPVRSLSVQ